MHVQYFPWASHRLAEVFPDPHGFHPERMSSEEKAKLPRGAYVPFGGGRRICLGKRFGYLEAKVIAARVLQSFVPEADQRAQPELRWAATLRPRNALQLRLSPR